MKYYSYIRVSTSQQDYDRQYKQLSEFCSKERINISDVEIIKETRTGTNFDRPLFLRLMETMKLERTKQDVCLILVENTRLGRSYDGNTKMFQELKDNDIKFVVTSCPILDTRVKPDNPASKLVVDIVLAVYNWIAESEHRTLMERTNAGRASAKDKGVKFGRKPFAKDDLPSEFIKYYESYLNSGGTETKKDLLYKVNGELTAHKKQPISRATLYNYMNLYDGKE